jgi:hypothetical protein
MTDLSQPIAAPKSRFATRAARVGRVLLWVLWDIRRYDSADLTNCSNHIHKDVGLTKIESDRHSHTLGMMSHHTFR